MNFQKIKKTIYVVLGILALLLAVLYFSLNNSRMQTLLTKRLVQSIEKKTGSKIEIGEIDFSFFSTLTLKDVFVSDNYKDTLLYVKKIDARISDFNISSNNFRFSNLKLEEPYLKVISYDDGSMNFFTFLNALEGKTDSTQTSSSYFFSVTSTTINKGRFVYLDSKRQPIPYGMNYDDLDFHNINGEVEDLRTVGNAIKMNITNIESEEKSGFKVVEGSTLFTIDSGLLLFNDVHIKSAKSVLNAKHLKFSYEPETGAWANFTKAMLLDYLITDSKIHLGEMALFNDNLLGYHELLSASAHITGTVQNMRVEDAKITTYDNTKFMGNVSLNGLPYIDETFIDASIERLETTLDDLEKIKIPNLEDEYLAFPQDLKKLGIFSYKGKYTGFISDFVFYGQFFSDFGDLKTDISVKPTTKTKQLEVSGKIITQDFKIGELLENKMFGKVSLNVNIVNAMANENYNSYAKVKGTINKIEIKDYPYENINIDGYFADKVFDGKVNMNNKIIAFDFNGKFDFHEKIPKTNFTLDVKHAQLQPLHLNTISEDKLAKISFKAKSKLSGGGIDDATGELTVYDLKYTNSKGKLNSNSIRLSSLLNGNTRILGLESDFADAILQGNFKISQLDLLPQNIASSYIKIPSLQLADSLISDQEGALAINLKNVNPILDLLADSIEISKNTRLSAHYNTGTNKKLQLKLDADLLKSGEQALHHVHLKSDGKNTLQTKLEIDRIDFSESFSLLGINLKNTLENSAMNTSLIWGDKETLAYSGNISLSSVFREIENKKLSIENTFTPTVLFLNNEDWEINSSKVRIDSTDITIDKFRISNSQEFLEIDGVISPNKENKLNAQVKNFEIKHLWNIFSPTKMDVAGKISGTATYQQKGEDYAIESDLTIPKLTIENEDIGTLSVFSEWNPMTSSLLNKASLAKNSKKLFSLEGNYEIEDGSLDYTANFNNLNLKLLEGFTKEYLTKIEGNIGGTVSIEGSLDLPIINGDLGVDISTITIAETGVSYHINEKLHFDDSSIDFTNFKIIDSDNKAAFVNGSILLGKGKNSNVDLNIKTQSFRILEDSCQPLAYGNARITADLQVRGTLDHVKVIGDIATENNSKIIVPYDSASEVGKNDFITFINPADSTKFKNNNDIAFIPTGSVNPVSFDVDFSINPTSEIQVLFESKSGSVLKSKGNADLFISRNEFGKQTIIGEYEVAKGVFFYSLENVVNKKFILQKGGTIRWNGAPEDAYVNIRAVYQTKASVRPLLYEEVPETKQQTTVLCKAHITGQLENPTLAFEIDFPNLDHNTKGNVQAALQTTDITKQVLSLLVFNQFTVPEYAPNNGGKALSVTTSELLSNQVSNMLSLLSQDVNIGFIYRPGDDLTKEELGLSFSKELLQNRVVISGNLGFSSQDENNRFNDFIGECNLDIKLNKKGNLTFRIFSHARDNLYYYENRGNIQGAGITYSEEFDTFKELIQRYKEKLGWRKKKDKK